MGKRLKGLLKFIDKLLFWVDVNERQAKIYVAVFIVFFVLAILMSPLWWAFISGLILGLK